MRCQITALFWVIMQCNNLEECSSHLLYGGSLKPCHELPVSYLSHGTVCSDGFLRSFSHPIQDPDEAVTTSF